MSAVAIIDAVALPVDAESPESWAPLIMEAWGSSVRGIIETGRLLNEAKKAVAHGEWERLCNTLLPFGARTALMLMRIATHDRLSNPKHASVLPPNWTTLEALTRLSPENFDEAVEAGIINPAMERRQAQRLARAGAVDAFRAAPQERPAPEDDIDEEAEAAENAAELVRRLLVVKLPVPGLPREAQAMIEAVATCARCSTQALWQADALRGAERQRAVAARRLAVYMLHIECEMSQPDACRPFGLEPSGASYIAKECEDYRDEPSFARFIERIEATYQALLQDGSFE